VVFVTDRLSQAERQLDRILAFFPRIDAKMSALLAIVSAEVGLFALNLTPGDLTLWYLAVPGAFFFITAVVVLGALYNCASPHLKGGSQSIVYFQEIANRTESNFIRDYAAISDDDLLRDVSAQIWRNSEIVASKFKSLKVATIGLLVSLLPWLITLAAISLTHHRLPLTHG